MTTIAVDENFIMSSDGMITDGGFISSYDTPKLFEVNGYRVGVSGRYAEALMFVNTLRELLKSDATLTTIPKTQLEEMELHDFTALVITPNNEVICYEGSKYQLNVSVPTAIGSGHVIARVAMSCGKCATQAVQEAIKFDVYSGGEVQSLLPCDKIKSLILS